MVLGLSGGIQAKATGLVADYAHQPGLAEPNATILHDYSRWKNHGTFKADGKPDWVQLPSGLWVMNFDENGRVTVSDHTSLRITGDLTLEAWVKWTSGAGYIMGKGEFDGYKFMWFLYVKVDGAISFKGGTVASDDYAWDITTTDTISSGVWTLIHAIKISTSGYIYINGSESKTGTVATNYSDAYDVTLGERIDGWEAVIDSISPPRIRKGALSAATILKHFTAERWWFGV